MSAVFKYEQELEPTSCCVCGIRFAVPPEFISNCRANAGHLYCPNGHRLGWSESDADRLRKKLEAEQTRVEMFRLENQEKERSIRALKGQITKSKNRIAKGVCPCCNRSFANLHRHMNTKHPDYTTQE